MPLPYRDAAHSVKVSVTMPLVGLDGFDRRRRERARAAAGTLDKRRGQLVETRLRLSECWEGPMFGQ